MERHASTSKSLHSKNKKEYEKEIIQGLTDAAKFLNN